MTELSKYRDKRSEFFQGFFEKAVIFDQYLADAGEKHRRRWISVCNQLTMAPDLSEITAAFTRKMHVLVLSDIRCGDCSRQGPMLQAVAETAYPVDLRFIEAGSNPELHEELRINGAARVPVVVALSEDFFEVARFGDRHLSVYRRKAANELGSACDAGILPPSQDELNSELSEWVYWLERVQLILRLAPMLRERYGD